MAKKDRFPEGYPSGPNCVSEGSGSSGRVEVEVNATENSGALRRKKSSMSNTGSRDVFGVPVEVLPVSKMSLSERKGALIRLRTELEQIQGVLKKVESQRTNFVSVSSSSDIVSCNNERNVATFGNMKRSSALSSETGKKLNPESNKARGWNRGTSGRFQSAKQPLAPCLSNSLLMKQCESLLKKLMSHEFGWVFNSPVDVVKLKLTDYFDVIKHPMDLGTINKKIASGAYSSPLDFAADVRLTFSNAKTYNPRGNDAHFMADTLSKFFEIRWKVIEKKLNSHVSKPVPEVSSIHTETAGNKPITPLKKRKISAVQDKVLQGPVKQRMTAEEKHKLSRDLESVLGELPDNIIEFLKEQSSTGNDEGEEEIEVDIDSLSDDTLFKLRKLLADYMNEKQNNSKPEPSDIELLNESGVSNASMQLHTENELIAEDVDIGRNEPPVSSYTPSEKQKDSGSRSNKCISPGSSSDSRSSSRGESDVAKASTSPTRGSKDGTQDNSDRREDLDANAGVADLVAGTQSVSGLDQVEQPSQQKPNSVESDCCQDGESAIAERPVSPDKLYRAALLKNRFADTILKAREKTLNQGEKRDPEKLRLEREKLELQKRKEKARLQAEAKAAEDARRRAEAEAAAEAKRQRDLEREAARQALLQMEKTVEINETSRFLEDLEMLRTVPAEQLMNSVEETIPDDEAEQDGLGSFKFGDSNPLEQLGLYMKAEDEEEDEEEVEPPPTIPNAVNDDDDVEEGEID